MGKPFDASLDRAKKIDGFGSAAAGREQVMVKTAIGEEAEHLSLAGCLLAVVFKHQVELGGSGVSGAEVLPRFTGLP